MAARGAGPMFGRGFGVRQTRSFMAAAPGTTGPVTPVLLGVACGALAVCGLQFLMVIMSEIELSRSVDSISE
jgi:hypothetical protein